MVGVLSAVIANITVMFAVLTMDPHMSHGQLLLVTLSAGVGGSLLFIVSAAGVALMSSASGVYTFGAHLKWTWAIALICRKYRCQSVTEWTLFSLMVLRINALCPKKLHTP